MTNEDFKDHIYAAIYCGGGGTRLWPYSHEKTPKQFLNFGTTKSLIRKTFERVLPLIPIDKIFVITLPEYLDEVKRELPEIPKKQVIAEPARRDTLLAAGYVTVAIKKKDPKAIVVNLWADQLIKDVEKFRESLLAGAITAWHKDALVTTGVKSEYAHPGLEYVQKGNYVKKLKSAKVYKVNKFIERPERSGVKPEVIFKNKNNLWHIGLWIWKADVFLGKVKKHSPSTHKTLQKIENYLGKFGGNKVINKEYEKSPKVQIDMVISGDDSEMYVVEGNFEWIDIGDFDVMWKIGKKDKKKNVTVIHGDSDWTDVDTEGSLILVEDATFEVATIGLKDMVVVAVKDKILVAPRSEAQKVKKIVNQLKEKKLNKFL